MATSQKSFGGSLTARCRWDDESKPVRHGPDMRSTPDADAVDCCAGLLGVVVDTGKEGMIMNWTRIVLAIVLLTMLVAAWVFLVVETSVVTPVLP